MFKIIAQLEEFIVVNKASGVSFHDEGIYGSGLCSSVQGAFKHDKLYPVHRLDKMTSGIVVFAKTLPCAQLFGQLFEQHKIEKYYIALSDKKPIKKQGLIKGDMTKSRRGSWKLLRTIKKPAITQFFSYALGGGKRLYLLKPHSGKTHQLRVALSSLGANILGDSQYSGTKADRGYLHAYALQFDYLGKKHKFIALPDQGELFLQSDILAMLDKLSTPWQLQWPKLK